MLENMEGKRRRGRQKTRWIDSIIENNEHEVKQAPGGSGRQKSLATMVHKVTKSRTRLNNNNIISNSYEMLYNKI